MSDFRAIDPCTDRVLATYERTPRAAIAPLARRSAEAQSRWAALEPNERATPVLEAARILRVRAGALALLMADEMGKVVAEGRAEVEKCAQTLEHFAQHAMRYLAPERITADRPHGVVAYGPLGLVLGVMPWNFPLWQIVRFVAPGLMAGNACWVKPAPSVPGCSLALQAVFSEAGLPEGLLALLFVPVEEVEDLLVEGHVRSVTLTGSVRAGKAVAALAAKHLVPSILELGGSDPYVVLGDADLEIAARACIAGRFVNAGQSCIAAKRWIVVDEVRAPFEKLVHDRMRELRMGQPRDPTTQLGPLARLDLRDALHDIVRRSVERGARLMLGGEVPAGPGAFYPATLLADVLPGMPAFDEETFGPVAALVPARDDADAVRLANATTFGLGAAVFSRDEGRAMRVATKIEAGCVAINAPLRSDPRLPFGGTKHSGWGRELGQAGIRALCATRTITRG